MKTTDLTLYGSNAPLSTASPLPTAVEHASVAGYEYTAPQQVNAFTSGYENILDMGFLSGMDTFPDMGSLFGSDVPIPGAGSLWASNHSDEYGEVIDEPAATGTGSTETTGNTVSVSSVTMTTNENGEVETVVTTTEISTNQERPGEEVNRETAETTGGNIEPTSAELSALFGSDAAVPSDYCGDPRTLQEVSGWNFGNGTASENPGAVHLVKAYLQSLGINTDRIDINKIAESAVDMARNNPVSFYSDNYETRQDFTKIYQNYCQWAAGAYLVDIGAVDAQTGAIAQSYQTTPASSSGNTTQGNAGMSVDPNNQIGTNQTLNNINQEPRNAQNQPNVNQNNNQQTTASGHTTPGSDPLSSMTPFEMPIMPSPETGNTTEQTQTVNQNNSQIQTNTTGNSNTVTEKEIDDRNLPDTWGTTPDINGNSSALSTSELEYIESDISAIFGDNLSEDERNTLYQKYLERLNDAKSQQTITAEERENIRREQDREFFLNVEAERLMGEYDSIRNRSRLNITKRDSLLNNSQTNAAISKLRETLGLPIESKGNANYETAIQQRNTMIRTICESGNGNTVNIENIERFRMYAVSPTGFERRETLEGRDRCDFDGEITITTGKETVKKINMLGALGVKFDTIMFNLHGEGQTSYSNGYEREGFYYGDRARYTGLIPNRNYVQGGNMPRFLIVGANDQAANWNEINWGGIVNNGFTLFMGSCNGYDDAGAIIKIIKEKNDNITGLTAYGRNYIGNWAGATEQPYINDIWRTQTEPMGLVKYSQDANGNIIQETTITHPASRYLLLNNATNWRARPALSPNYRPFAGTAIENAPRNYRELYQKLNWRNNQ